MSLTVSIEPRATKSLTARITVPAISLVAALLAGGVVIAIAGNDPIEAYSTMFKASFGGWRAVARTLTLTTPLTLTGLAAALAFRMKIWNIGAEGQLYMGAIAATAVALVIPAEWPSPVVVFMVLLTGACVGAVWAGFAALPKAYLNTDEVITTLMLNFIALSFMNYLIFGTFSFWRDPEASFPVGKTISQTARLPIVFDRLHYGIAIALAAAVLLWWTLSRTSWGFELRVMGDTPAAARYAGMEIRFKVLSVLALSGALAGVAGAIEVSGAIHSLDPRALAVGLGFTGIVVAAVARLNPLGVVPVAILLAALVTSGSRLQQIGVEPEIAVLLQGLIFLFVAAGEFFRSHKVRLVTKLAASVARGGIAADE